MNIENMKTLRNQIARLKDEQFRMDTWLSHPGDTDKFDYSCGTVGCVAGWAKLLNGSKEGTAEGWTRKWLNLTYEQSMNLFYAEEIRFEDGELRQLESVTRAEILVYMDKMIAQEQS